MAALTQCVIMSQKEGGKGKQVLGLIISKQLWLRLVTTSFTAERNQEKRQSSRVRALNKAAVSPFSLNDNDTALLCGILKRWPNTETAAARACYDKC